MTESINPLLDAVDALTLERTVHTTLTDDDGSWLRVHSEKHPPLLQLLLEGTGITQGGKSSDVGIPIDADALEMWAQIHDLVRLWCKQLDTSFADDLQASVRNWYLAHDNAVRSGKIGAGTDRDVTHMVEGWVRMIENKFEPDVKREWLGHCPAIVPTLNLDGDVIGHRHCDARRLVVNGLERFAIEWNITRMEAVCARCRTKWVGTRGIASLQYETNVWEMEKAEDDAKRIRKLEDLTHAEKEKERKFG